MKFLFVLLIIFLASFGAAAQEETGSIHGLVFDKETGAPVQGISVLLGDQELAKTSRDGAFHITVRVGTVALTLSGEGYPSISTGPITVLSGEVTEALVEISRSDDESTMDLETAESGTEDTAPLEKKLPLSTIEGRIVDEERKEPISGARVFVRGLAVEAMSDADGNYTIEVPVGTHDISVIHSDYSSMSETGIEVVEGKPARVDFEAIPVSVELEAFDVTAPRIEGSAVDLLKERKESSQVNDVIGAEQMSRAGDSDAAGALKRVTGVTIVGGKFVYVRGLGERYSSTLLNGLHIPSPEPERRVVPLDMFPTGILDSVVIQKTYSADMPGEFGGGVVLLRTKTYPKQFVLKIEASGGINVGTTFHNGIVSADQGPTDWLGIDGGHRDIPADLSAVIQDNFIVVCDMFTTENCLTEEQLAELSNAFPNNWKTKKQTIPPNGKLTLTIGNSWKIKKAKLGFMATGLYSNEWDMTKEHREDYTFDSSSNTLNTENSYDFDNYDNTITLGGILTLGAEIGEDHVIRANTILNRITDNSFYIYAGFSRDSDRDIRVYNHEWIERMVLSQQVIGEHVLDELWGLKLDWRYAFSKATRYEPDKRSTSYKLEESTGNWVVYDHKSGNKRDYLEVSDDVHDLALDLTLPFTQWTNEAGSIKSGGAIMLKERVRDVRRFYYRGMGGFEDPYAQMLPGELYEQDLGALGVDIQEGTENTDNAVGEQEIFAGYLMGDVPLGLGFRATAGARVESSKQSVRSFALFSSTDEVVFKTIDNIDLLPSGMLTYEIMDGMLVRVGYGRTLNRPDFREMSPVCFYAYVGGGDVCGAPETIEDPETGEEIPYTLKRTVIHNVDARWEWYFSEAESLSLGVFYKQFEDPIETVFFLSGGSTGTQFVNAKAARNYGIEIDFIKNFGFISPPMEDFYVGGNLTFVRSEIELYDHLAQFQDNEKRPLQGQSPYILNGQIGYNNVDIGSTVTLLYNVYGERLSAVGANGRPNVYEQPYHQLDFVAKQKLAAGFDLGFKAQNLIDLPHEFIQGGNVSRAYRKGRTFSLSLSWAY